MIQELKDIPNSLVAFRTEGELDKKEFDTIVVPAVAELVKRAGKINCLLVTDIPATNLIFGAWLQDAMTILNEVRKWNRSALVTPAIGNYEKYAGTLAKYQGVPGEFKVFPEEHLQHAIYWTGEQNPLHPVQIFGEEGEAED